MNLKFEYNQDIVIEGKAYSLNFVDNVEKADGYLITRRYRRADGKDTKSFEQFVPKAVKPAAGKPAVVAPVAAAPAPAPAAKAPTAEEKKPEPKAEEPKPEPAEKRSLASRFFGGKKKSKR